MPTYYAHSAHALTRPVDGSVPKENAHAADVVNSVYRLVFEGSQR